MRHVLMMVAVALGVFASSTVAAETGGEPPCYEPALWMAQHGTEGFVEPWCARCPYDVDPYDGTGGPEAQCRAHAKRIAQMARRDAELRPSFCREVEYAIESIRTWHGRGLSDPSWEPYFTSTRPWFGERPRSAYPAPATALLDDLRAVRAQCLAWREEHAAYIRPVIRALKSGRFGHTAAVISTWQGAGLREDTFVRFPYTRRTSYALGILEEPKPLEDYLWMAEHAYGTPPTDFFRGPLTPWWRRQKVHAEFRVGGDGSEIVVFLLSEDGRLLGQTWDQVACPFVYTRSSASAEWSYHGEILRNLRHPELEGAQRLDVSAESSACDGQVELRLAEEKPETTYLDAVALEVGGERLLPAECVEEPSRAFCAEDGVYELIEEGQVLDLRFEIPARLRDACRHSGVNAWADGYYLPHR